MRIPFLVSQQSAFGQSGIDVDCSLRGANFVLAEARISLALWLGVGAPPGEVGRALDLLALLSAGLDALHVLDLLQVIVGPSRVLLHLAF